HNVLTRPRRRYRVGCRCARLEDSGSTDRHGDVFTTVHLIDGRHAFLWTWQIVFPKDLAVILVVRPKFSIRRASCENESAGSDNHATTWCDAANVFAGLSKSRHAAVRNLPENLAGVEIISGQLRPRRPHDRQPADTVRCRSCGHEVIRRGVIHE